MHEETTNNVGETMSTADHIMNNADKKLKISMFINAILFIAVVILYILFFTEKKQAPVKDIQSQDLTGSVLRVGYVESDSILANYSLALEKSKELEAKGKNLEATLNKRKDQYEKDASYFQEQVSNNKLSEQSAQYIYNQLMEEQQKIYDLQNQYSAELAEMEMQVNIMLLDSVTNFLERYNRQFNFDYILGHNPGSNLLLKNPKYNLTKQVIEGLNHEYAGKAGE
ncbi:MAG: OmpH family outer membrane protein [Bacteroidales bacterium]|nr:OmpH family outer membrane protein [Bacteroidales bacterium]